MVCVHICSIKMLLECLKSSSFIEAAYFLDPDLRIGTMMFVYVLYKNVPACLARLIVSLSHEDKLIARYLQD